MPETFSSEIGHVQPNSDRSSFNDEFRGASDSLIERDRPPHPIHVGRRGRRLLFVIVVLAVLGSGGWAVWYWSEPIGEWIASWNRSEAPVSASDPVEPEEPAQPEPVPSEPEPEPVFGVKGAPEGSEPAPPIEPPIDNPTIDNPAIDPPQPIEPGEGLPVEPLDTPPTSTSKAASVAVAATNVRGKVASASVSSKLAVVDKALEGCWTSAAAKPETKRPASVKLRFGIKWNGRAFGIAVEGDAPEAVRKCVREAVPSSGWPQPRDGGEAQVSRDWSLE